MNGKIQQFRQSSLIVIGIIICFGFTHFQFILTQEQSQHDIKLLSFPKEIHQSNIAPPITIDGNNELAYYAHSGTGIAADPYIIANLTITCGTNGSGLFLQNTNKFVKIVNISISIDIFINTSYGGLEMRNVSNCYVQHCSIQQHYWPLILRNSTLNFFQYNSISDYDAGIQILNSTQNEFSNNTLNPRNQIQIISFTYSFYLDGSLSNHFIDNTILNNTGIGFYLLSESNNNTFEHNKIVGSSKFGYSHNPRNQSQIYLFTSSFYLDGSLSNQFIANTILNNIGVGFYLLSGSNYNTFEQNKIVGSNEIHWPYSYSMYNYSPAAFYVWDSYENLINNNEIDSHWYHGIILVNAHDNILLKNQLLFTRFGGISLYNSSTNHILENRIEDEGNGILLYNSNNNVIKKNCLFGTSIYLEGDSIDQCEQSSVVNNTIDNKPLAFYQGKSQIHIGSNQSHFGQIVLLDCSKCSINGQIFHDSQVAISIIFSDQITISNNTMYNLDEAMQIYHSNNITIDLNILKNNRDAISNRYSDDTLIAKNTFDGNHNGLHFYESSNCNITYNVFMNHSNTAISFSNSSQNLCYLNSFINNSYHIVSNSENQWYWDEQGNYWDTYEGVDENNDGIGDIAFEIPDEPGNFDLYPLINPPDSTEKRKIPGSPLGLFLMISVIAFGRVSLIERRKHHQFSLFTRKNRDIMII